MNKSMSFKIILGTVLSLLFLVFVTGFLTKRVTAQASTRTQYNKIHLSEIGDGLILYNNNGTLDGATNFIYKNGFFGVGEPTPLNLFEVAGSMAIGVDYTSSVAPENGLKIQGHTLIGSPFEKANGATLQVTGSASFSKNIIVGNAKDQYGITMYDKITGTAYCLEIANGIIENRLGECPDSEY